MRPSVLLPALLLLAAAGSSRAFVVPFHHQRQRRSSARLAEIGPLPGPAAASSQAPPPAPEAPAPAPPAKPLLRVLGPDGKELRTFEAKAGANLRKTLQAQRLDVYDLMGKMTNCNGAGQCGTCAVKLESDAWGPRSDYEAQKLAKKYGSSDVYRLACQTLVEAGEATVTLQPPPPKKK